jgi:hypothetical protein
MRTLLLVGLALALGLSCARADVGSDIRSLCEREWPDEFSMQEFCIKEETSSHAAVQRIRASTLDTHPVGSKIHRKCLKEWTEDLTEWSMVKFCLVEEVGSYNRLHPDKAIEFD